MAATVARKESWWNMSRKMKSKKFTIKCQMPKTHEHIPCQIAKMQLPIKFQTPTTHDQSHENKGMQTHFQSNQINRMATHAATTKMPYLRNGFKSSDFILFYVYATTPMLLRSQFLPLRPAEAGVCGRELAPFPGAAVLHVRHRLNRNELGIRADENKLPTARPPAAGRTLLVIDRNVVHRFTPFVAYYNKI